MKLGTHTDSITAFDGGLLVIGRFADGTPSAAEKAVDAALGGALSAAATRLFFAGKPRQAVAIDTVGQLPATRVLLLGLGNADKITPAIARDFAALGAREAQAQRLDNVGIALPEGVDAGELALGFELGAWTYTTSIKDDPKAPRHSISAAQIITDADISDRLAWAADLASGVLLARQLVTEPPNICTPERLAQVARDLASFPGVTVKVLGRAEIEAEKMGGLVAVSQGGHVEPRFIHITYAPEGATAPALALVGKGITFDSGGLSIKPSKGMEEMHMDMGGAGAVLGAMHAIVRQAPNVPVHGIVAACENMPDGKSYRVSDVLTMYSGRTVEVLNTDAEGRLVLADALWYAQKLKPRLIVDLATLTGACLVGLGQFTTALYSDDDALAAEVAAAGTAADERYWRMPLEPKLAESLKSKRADTTNLGGRWGGSITAAQFLQGFKGDAGWAHLDIAGPAMGDKPDGYICEGGTGFGVLTLVALAQAAADRG